MFVFIDKVDDHKSISICFHSVTRLKTFNNTESPEKKKRLISNVNFPKVRFGKCV